VKLLIINGPNLNFLGIREPSIYGSTTYKDLCSMLEDWCAAAGAECELFQSNCEGAIVDRIVMNPAAYTHTSVAILDALKATAIPTVEVHISDVSTREAFRHHSYVSLAAKHTIIGHGIDGYREGIEWLARELRAGTL
jgi:3-dehydroquinate dehydratase-2